MNADWTATIVNDTEADLFFRGTLEFRLSLLNRAQRIASFGLARPGLGGGFEVNYKWAASFKAVSRTLRQDIKAVSDSVGGGDDLAECLMRTRRELVNRNKHIMPRTRA